MRPISEAMSRARFLADFCGMKTALPFSIQAFSPLTTNSSSSVVFCSCSCVCSCVVPSCSRVFSSCAYIADANSIPAAIIQYLFIAIRILSS